MKNIHLIPTIPNDETAGGIWIPKTRDWCNVYITSDEEIREGDWCYHPLLKGGCIIRSKFDNPNSTMKKIVLTTDEDLIKDGVQAIDDEFLEWFVKNPSCEDVEVQKLYKNGYGNWYKNDSHFIASEIKYKTIIPKEEPKQETLEEAVINFKKTDVYINEIKQEQDKKLYSEEEFRNTLLDINLVNPSHLQMTSNGHGEFPDGYKLTQKGVDYIIEQFKNK